MDLALTAADETAVDETADLWSWLRRENDLRAHVALRAGEIPAGTMGAEYYVAASLAAASVLARSICSYLAVRENRRGSDVVLTMKSKAGGSTTVTINRATEPVRLAELFLNAEHAGPENRALSGRDDDAPSGR